MKQNNKFGWWILAVLIILPSLMWIFQAPLTTRFSSISSATRSIGDIAGLTGMAMFSLIIILSARLKIFEKFFNGINEVYVVHHFLGGVAFCLLLFHPLFLVYNYLLVSFQSAALFLLPSVDNWAQNFGIFGLFVMTITLVITFYMKIRYQIWKFTHKFLGLAFIFAFFHILLIGADVASNNFLKIYLFILGLLAIISYFYRVLLGKYFVKKYLYTVKSIFPLPDSMYEVVLNADNKEMTFTAGQFAFVRFFNKTLTKEAHPFSMTSAPGQPLAFVIKELGDYTKKINSLKTGDKATLEGPFGNFNFRNYGKKQIWIAGGVGITPFLSMQKSIKPNDNDFRIKLYYSAKNAAGFVRSEEIKKAVFWSTDEKGFLTASFLKNNEPDFLEQDFLICGPPAMMSSLKNQLMALGVKRENIHTEDFALY